MRGNRLPGGSALVSEPSGQPNVVIRLVGTGFACPKVRVFIDGRPVGTLSDCRARALTLGEGVHRVVTNVGFMRSRTLVLSLAPRNGPRSSAASADGPSPCMLWSSR